MKNNKSGACFFLMALFMIFGCNSNRAANQQTIVPLPVAAKQIGKTSAVKEISASGNIEGRKTVKLGFLVAGRVNYIAVHEGDTLQAGQLLASLDPESYKIAKEMADANLAQAQDEFHRLSMMHERESVADGDFSKISNTLKLARAQQRLQSKNLSDTKLYSPINGVLLKRGAEVGEIAGVGLPLFAVSDIGVVHVSAAVPESDLRQVKIGSLASVSVSSAEAAFTGKVVEIGSLAEPATRSFSVKIDVNNPGFILRPGMTAEVKIMSGQKKDVLAVPVEAVLRDLDNTSYIFIADQSRKQAFKRKISLGRMMGNNIEVTSGVASDEWVIVGGQHKLNDGSAITLK